MTYYSDEMLRLIWNKATPTIGYPEFATDCEGRTMQWSEYGKQTPYGWHVDHIVPTALGGSDDFANLRPRHHLGNTIAGGLLGAFLNR